MQQVTTKISGGKSNRNSNTPRNAEQILREAPTFLAEHAKQEHDVIAVFCKGEKYADMNGEAREALNDGFMTIPSRLGEFLAARGIDVQNVSVEALAGAGVVKTWRLPTGNKPQKA